MLAQVYGKRVWKMFFEGIGMREIAYKNQLWVPLKYKGLELDTELRLDVLVGDQLCVELKAQAEQVVGLFNKKQLNSAKR